MKIDLTAHDDQCRLKLSMDDLCMTWYHISFAQPQKLVAKPMINLIGAIPIMRVMTFGEGISFIIQVLERKLSSCFSLMGETMYRVGVMI